MISCNFAAPEISSLTFVIVSAIMVAAEGASSLAQEPDRTRERAVQSVEAATAEVQRFAFHFADDRDTKLELQPTPVLRYTNPLRGEVCSTVFVWTHRGRPEVIASVSSWHSPRRWVGFAVTSLSTELLVGERDGQAIWRPQKAGLEFHAIPGAPPPGDLPANRLRQMSSLARQFTAEFKRIASVNEGGKLRLLSRPLYRYELSREDVLDGAIFGFADGAAPHLLLLVEARKTTDRF